MESNLTSTYFRMWFCVPIQWGKGFNCYFNYHGNTTSYFLPLFGSIFLFPTTCWFYFCFFFLQLWTRRSLLPTILHHAYSWSKTAACGCQKCTKESTETSFWGLQTRLSCVTTFFFFYLSFWESFVKLNTNKEYPKLALNLDSSNFNFLILTC